MLSITRLNFCGKDRGHYPTRIENEKDIVINKEIFEVIKEYIKDT